ncbi:MAG: 50S ribosomal protein L19 [Candidatus Omnitrophica bacterium]|nr:50S ribosomal protein L19 [Candidatus Omnitrophota bacterium]
MNRKIALVEKKYMKEKTPAFRVGDQVKVHTRVHEGDKTRTQIFEGMVIRRHGSGLRESFTVLRTERGDQIEKIFPLHSPTVEKVVVEKAGDVRKSRLYHLREKKQVVN